MEKGYAQNAIVAVGPTSVIAPGDAGQMSTNFTVAPSIAVLTLSGGVTAMNGLTMDFKLNGDSTSTPTPGVNNDALSVGDLTLGGTVTVNFTAMDALQTDTDYELISGSGTWSRPDAFTFNFNAPAGYKVSSYDYDPNGLEFNVQFEATPEPSTYLMVCLGAVVVGLIAKKRRVACL